MRLLQRCSKDNDSIAEARSNDTADSEATVISDAGETIVDMGRLKGLGDGAVYQSANYER